MSNTTANLDLVDPLADVSSFYGTGTHLGWVCTVVSVIINWTFNPEVRDTDSLTNDFLAMLAIPVVATGHVLYLVLHHGATIAQLAPDDPAIARHVAAVEAPLRTCMVFVVVIRCMENIAIHRCHPKRIACCLLTGLIVTVGQFPVLTRSEWPHKDWAPLSFMFVFLLAATIEIGFIGGFVQVVFMWATSPPATLGYPGIRQAGLAQIATRGDPRPGFACGRHWHMKKRRKTCENCHIEARVVLWAYLRAKWPSLAATTVIWAGIFLLSFACLCFINGRAFNPLPESSNGILELDQLAALLLGLVTVWCTLREAVRSSRDGRGAEDGLRSEIAVAKDILKLYSVGELVTLVKHIPPPLSSTGSRADWGAWFRRKILPRLARRAYA